MLTNLLSNQQSLERLPKKKIVIYNNDETNLPIVGRFVS